MDIFIGPNIQSGIKLTFGGEVELREVQSTGVPNCQTRTGTTAINVNPPAPPAVTFGLK